MDFFLGLILAPLTLLTLCIVVELVVGLRPLPPVAAGPANAPRVVVVVPAHDEQAILAGRLALLKEAASGQARILVVADNCSDSTADIARSLGVEVIERVDPDKRGKGFALDYARRELQRDPPDVVLIVDADCSIDRTSIARLSACCAASGDPCQAVNLQAPAPGRSLTVKLSTFAFFIKNVIRQRALQRLAGRVHLLGTGMALPWKIFAAADLATGNIVEDVKLGQDLAQAGYPPRFVEEATVWSNPETETSTLSQRRRWEGGFLQHALSAGPGAFRRSLLQGDLRGLWAAVDIMIPPLAMLLLADLAVLALASVLTWLAGASWWPAGSLAAALVLAGAGLGLAWTAGGRRFVSLADLARLPLYLAWKIPLYFGLLRDGAPEEWKRTDRSAAPHPGDR